jgi:NAD(P)-dependent dehydrogenase (short-subunit alcohol dehydrogenase family)
VNGRPLEARRAVVTGASRGIGRALAVALAGGGADVALVGRDVPSLEATGELIAALGARSEVIVADVTDANQVERLVERALAGLGGIDILVNCSGVLSSTSLLETSEAEWDWVMGTNAKGSFLVTRAVGAHLVAQGSGKVINVASNFAFKGVANHAAYCASKAAIVALTRCAAIEWARYNIQVNALAPGYVATDLNADARDDPELAERITRTVPARRFGRAEELGDWVVLLASSASDYMTGETIVVDGGLLAR